MSIHQSIRIIKYKTDDIDHGTGGMFGMTRDENDPNTSEEERHELEKAFESEYKYWSANILDSMIEQTI